MLKGVKHSELNPLHNGVRFNFCMDKELTDVFSNENQVLLKRSLECYCWNENPLYRGVFENVSIVVRATEEQPIITATFLKQ